MSATFRFAPSPTGLLHLGNARTLILNACLALREGGRLILRLDDTDAVRSGDAFAAAIREDVGWLGAEPALTVRQSERAALYAAAAERLRAAGRLYPAYETPEELEAARAARLARGERAAYDRASLDLTPAERRALEAAGRRPHWRFRLDHDAPTTWTDGVRGPCAVDPASLSDPVLVREDGVASYTLASVVDDIALAVTDVVRGEDHVTNTAVQLQLFAALGAEAPRFAHHNLFTDAEGRGLSKRLGHLALRSLREEGVEPMAVAAYAALHGSAESPAPAASLAELAERVSLGALSRAPARIDEAELTALSARVVHALPYAAARARLDALGVGGGEAFWLAVRGNLARLAEAADLWARLRGPTAPDRDEDDEAFLAEAAALLPPGPWDAGTWAAWTGEVAARTGRRGRALYRPLRRALTGAERGPEMAALLPFVPPEAARARLEGRTG